MLKLISKMLLLALIILLFSCSDTTTTEPSSKEIHIGGLFTMSGNLESLGQDSKAAMELAIDDANKFLAESGIDIKVRGFYEDTELNPEKAKAKMELLYSRGIRIFVGPSASSEVSAVKSTADTKGAVVISHYSTAGSLAIAGDNVFRFCPTDRIQAPAVMKLMKLDKKTAVIPIWRDDAGNAGLVESLKANKNLYSLQVSDGVSYQANETDFSNSIAELRKQLQSLLQTKQKSEVCIYTASFDEIIKLFDQIPENDILTEVNWYGSDGIALNLQLLNDVKAAKFAEKVKLSCPNLGLAESAKLIWQPITVAIKQKTGNSDYNPYSVAVYDAVWVAVKAAMIAGTTDIEKFKNTFILESSQHFGATGRNVLDVNGDKAIGDYWFYEVKSVNNKLNWVKTAIFDGNTGIVERSL